MSIESRCENGIATLTLQRSEKRNALTSEMIEQMLSFVRAARGDESIRLLRFESTGAVFCAGMDLGQMKDRAASPNANELYEHDSRIYKELVLELFEFPAPTLAVLQGPVLAGGVGAVLACDLVVAAEECFFALPEPQRGIVAAIVTPLLSYRAGNGVASYLLLSGKRMNAFSAKAMGLIHEVVTQDELLNAASEIEKTVLNGSRTANALTKEHLIASSGVEMERLLDASIALSAKARESEDAQEGLAAFLEKRNPNWQR